MHRRLSLLVAAFAGLAVSAAAGGCSDDVVKFPGDGGSGGTGEVEKQTQPAPGGVRRLLARQYVNSVRVIFGDAAAAAADPPDDLRVKRLASIGAADLAMPITAVEQYDRSAELVGRAFAADPDGLDLRWPCEAGALERSCFEDFVASAGRLAWRRSLDSSEVADIVDIAMDAVTAYESFTGDPFVEGVQFAVSALLNAPEFLYIVELGDPNAEDPAKRPLTQTELATRMSFFLTDTTPNEDLLEMAEAGELETDEDLRNLARQLVERESARDALTAFFDETYQIDRLPTVSKNDEVFPLWNEEVAAAMHQATLRFINDVIWSGDARMLMNADFTYVNDLTAPFYGLESTSAELERVSIPASQPRRGLMGQAGILAIFSAAARSSPTKRGVFIQDALRCITVPPPPPDVVPELPEPDPDNPMTMKERLIQVHMKEEQCAGCHAIFDPVGLAFEQFDGVGEYRTKDENDLTIDPSGEQNGLGTFANAAEAADLLAENEDVPTCLVQHIFRNSMGHVETEGEEAALDALGESFVESEFRVQDLLVEIVASPAFKLVGEPK